MGKYIFQRYACVGEFTQTNVTFLNKNKVKKIERSSLQTTHLKQYFVINHTRFPDFVEHLPTSAKMCSKFDNVASN